MRVLAVVVMMTAGCAAAEPACDPEGAALRCPEGFVCTDSGECQAYPAWEQPSVEGCVPYGCADFDGACGELDDGCDGIISCPCGDSALCGSERDSNGSVAAGDLGAGQVSWVHLPSWLQCNDLGAKALLDGGAAQGTRRLETRDLALGIPEHATVLEVVVTLRRMKEGPVPVRDELVTLMLGGAPVGANLASADAWPSLAWGEVTYRDADWDVPGGLTPAMVNDPSFGVAVRAKKEGDNTVAAYVDCATVLVRYACD